MADISSPEELTSSQENALIHQLLGSQSGSQMVVLSDVEIFEDNKENKSLQNVTNYLVSKDMNSQDLSYVDSTSLVPSVPSASLNVPIPNSPDSCSSINLTVAKNSPGPSHTLPLSTVPSVSSLNTTTMDASFLVPTVPMLQSSLVSNLSHSVSATSCLPARKDWPGEYGFNVYFPSQKDDCKGVTSLYSASLDKLYVVKDAPCPINFVVTTPVSFQADVRAVAFYVPLEFAKENVKRCLNHTMIDMAAGINYADHLIRANGSQVKYETSKEGHHSVVFPFDNPPVGQNFSTYIYKFTCFGSCPGGLNRRPIVVVFSLEKTGVVLGRKVLHVKICACPTRDLRNDLKHKSHLEKQPFQSKKRKSTDGNTDVSSRISRLMTHRDTLSDFNGQSTKVFTITVKDYRLYKFLRYFKKLRQIEMSLDPSSRMQLLNQTDIDTTTTDTE